MDMVFRGWEEKSMSGQKSLRPLALVTGASSGIGKALAKLLAKSGYDLIITARREEELDELAAELRRSTDAQLTPVGYDLAPRGAAAGLASEIMNRGLAPDLVVNNAGFGLMGPAAELDAAEQGEIVGVNVNALTDLSLHYAKIMGDRGHGGIMNISSVAGTLPGPNMAVYYATKAYILSFTEALAVEMKPKGVTVTAVLPGVTSTGFHTRAGMNSSRLMKTSSPMSAEAVARIALEGFKKKRRVVVTGLFNKFAVLCTRFVPRFILLPVTAKLHTD